MKDERQMRLPRALTWACELAGITPVVLGTTGVSRRLPLWERLGETASLSYAPWPAFDAALAAAGRGILQYVPRFMRTEGYLSDIERVAGDVGEDLDAARAERGIVPAAAFAPVDGDHVIGENLAETRIDDQRRALRRRPGWQVRIPDAGSA